MSNVLLVQDSTIIQSADNISWVLGTNHITFPEAFCDDTFTFTPTVPDGSVVEIDGTRTETGVDVDVSTVTTKGSWWAQGCSDEFRSSALTTVGLGNELIQRGTDIAVVGGDNTIPYTHDFSDTTYTLGITGVDGLLVNLIPGSKTVSSFQVNSPADGLINYIAIGT